MKKVLIIDSETTGLIEPIEYNEVAYLEIGDIATLGILDTFEQRYKPTKPSELGALVTHGIMEEELVECPPYGEFYLPKDTYYIIGANVDYDWKVLGKPDVKRICITALARYLIEGLDSYSQSALLYYFERSTAKEKLINAHSALADIKNCRLVLGYLLSIVDKPLTSFEDLWELSEVARIPKTLSFGKHRGLAIKDVPKDYLRWLKKQVDLDEYLRLAIGEYI